MKRTYQPKKSKSASTHGFLSSMSTSTGSAIINASSSKGSKQLTVSDE